MDSKEQEKIERLKEILQSAQTVVIGAGAGLSTSAGFTYSGERFQKYFGDFAQKYGFSDMYSGGFFPFESLEEHWAYWSRYILVNRYVNAPKRVYSDLLELISGKDYFVLTTNVDHCFQKVGFEKSRLFYTQGDYGLFQCSVPCCKKTYDNEKIVQQMCEDANFSESVENLKNVKMKISQKLVPLCPICKKPMSMNLRADSTFVEDDGWQMAAVRYEEFLKSRKIDSDGKVLFLELGVGANTPAIIKYPFWQMTAQNKNAFYACINFGEAACPKEIENKSICIKSNIGEVLKKCLKF